MSFRSPLRPPRLSKSRFLSGLQCTKRLYLEVHAPELATQIDEQRQAMLDMGKDIGQTAQQCFPGGQLVDEDYRHSTAALERTAALLADPAVPAIFEAAFQFEGTLIRVDVLERVNPDSWRLIEVKAASRVKTSHLNDLAVQTYVLKGNGISLVGSYLMHINRHYVHHGGAVDLTQLFSIEDLTEDILERLSEVPKHLDRLRTILLGTEPPAVEPDGHCHTPYECPFWEHCTQHKPERWVYHLPGGKEIVRRLMKQGIESIDDIPPQTRLTILQRRMKENVEWISPELSRALRSVQYPVHHLDFETFMPAIPLYPGTRPYQPLPTQWSNHIEYEDSSLRHDAHLSTDHKDPREEVAVSLLDSLGKEGSICVYSDYERYVLKSLADALPSLRSDLLRVINRLWDLFAVIQSHYYHPDFLGSFSIKSVLPAMVPELAYKDLEIQNGASASAMYYRMVFAETDWVERERLASALHAYCERDTLGMVALRRTLDHKAQSLGA